jgi:hypothetical protein
MLGLMTYGQDWWVSDDRGSDGRSGRSHTKPKKTIQAAVDRASPGDIIFVDYGTYDETVTIPFALSNLRIQGIGARGAPWINPTTSAAPGMEMMANECEIVNLGIAGESTAPHALRVWGAGTKLFFCKMEGSTAGMKVGPGTIAEQAAETHGDASFVDLYECEFAWNTNGIVLVGNDYGAVTQFRVHGGTFHDNSAADFEEEIGSGGSAGVLFRDLDIDRVRFRRQEDGTEPTKYISLDGDNGNKGVVSGCQFPSALAGGKNLVSTGLIWTGNYHTGGISNGQPS